VDGQSETENLFARFCVHTFNLELISGLLDDRRLSIGSKPWLWFRPCFVGEIFIAFAQFIKVSLCLKGWNLILWTGTTPEWLQLVWSKPISMWCWC